MSIVRVTVRTFQTAEHAELLYSQVKALMFYRRRSLKLIFTMAQSERQKNQVISIWHYDDENHMKEVRKKIASLNKLPNSLMPKEIANEAKVVHSVIH